MRHGLNFLMLIFLAATIAFAGCRGPADPWANVVHSDVLDKAGVQYYWQKLIDLSKGERIARLLRLDENLYCLTDRNRIIAIDAQKGVFKWSQTIGTPAQMVFRFVHVDRMSLGENVATIEEIVDPAKLKRQPSFGALIVNTENRVTVINRDSGQVVRDIPFNFVANTGGGSDGKSFFVASTGGVVYMVQLEEAAEFPVFSPEAMISSPIACYGGNFYVGTVNSRFQARLIRPQGSAAAWTKTLGGAVMAASPERTLFYVGDNGCFVPCSDGRLYAFHPLHGGDLWNQPFVCQGPLISPVQVGKQTIFQYADRDKLYAIDLATGRKRWDNPAGRLALSVMDNEVFMLDGARNLLIVDEMLGTVKQSFAMTGYELFAANTLAPAVWAASVDGKVVCIRKLSAGHLKPDMLGPTTRPMQ